jgi:hypothetical protein
MMKDVIKARNVPMDLQIGNSLEVASGVGQHASVEDGSISQQAVEVEFVSQQSSEAADAGAQQASEAAGAGAQHADSTSWINLISLVMISHR